MRKIFLLLPFFLIVSSGCNNYGKKVRINDTLEVYLKGDSVSESDAKKLGNYISNLMKDSKNEKSFQLLKDSGSYIVKMVVVDGDKVKNDSTLDVSFMALKALIELEVFKHNKVKFVITDNEFNDLKTF